MSYASLSSLIWSVADLLRGDFKQSEYGKVILPFTVLRRLDCILAPTKEKVLAEKVKREAQGINPEKFMLQAAKLLFVNTSPLDLKKLVGDQDNLATNLNAYIASFSDSVKDIFERFRFAEQVERLRKSNLLYQVTQKFSNFDLSPTKVTNHDMGLAFEDLIRRFAELSNETAGEHYTPRDAIQLMVNLLFIEDSEVLTPGNPVVRTIYDPTAGTGGMLSVAGEHLLEHNSSAVLTMFGQELNDESYAICKADMLIKGQDVRNIVPGNTLSEDGHATRKFDYMLSNPPFGVEWKKVEKEVRKEHEQKGFAGRFGPGLPRVSDGSMLFLLHLLSKMRPAQEGGSRFGIVLNGSPLFTGGAGSGESEIRRYVLENDLLEAIIALPTDMFFNTAIATYVWIVSNRKSDTRKNRVQLIDASSLYGNTEYEKLYLFASMLLPLLDYGRERDGVDLSALRLTHHKMRDLGQQVINLGGGKAAEPMAPITDVGSGQVQDKHKLRLHEIIRAINDLFVGEITEGDAVTYIDNVLKAKLLESETLQKQAAANTKEQFSNSPALSDELIKAIIQAMDAHETMSKQALNSDSVQERILSVLLGPSGLYEALRKVGTGTDQAAA